MWLFDKTFKEMFLEILDQENKEIQEIQEIENAQKQEEKDIKLFLENYRRTNIYV